MTGLQVYLAIGTAFTGALMMLSWPMRGTVANPMDDVDPLIGALGLLTMVFVWPAMLVMLLSGDGRWRQ